MSRAIRVLLAVAAVTVILPAPRAHAWGATGHMITAQIAYDDLTPAAKAGVDSLISVFAGYPPRMDSFVQAATWMDEIKDWGAFTMFDGWHFADMAFNPDSLPDLPPPAPENVVWAINEAKATLATDKPVVFQKALALRMLIHFVGDVHQPLHCGDRYTKERPQGDYGGNLFQLAGPEKELHAYWDDTAGLFAKLSAGSDDWRKDVPAFASTVTSRVPKTAVPQWADGDPECWANESLALVASDVYAGIQEGTQPSEEYEARAQKIVLQRLALGGYRLAALLNGVFE